MTQDINGDMGGALALPGVLELLRHNLCGRVRHPFAKKKVTREHYKPLVFTVL
jgi:hypothetical protein